MEVSNLWERVRPRMLTQLQQGLGEHVIADFCKVAPSTVRDWKSNAHPPKGERLLRLWHLLWFTGSNSLELETLPMLNRYIGELLVFGLISQDEACDMAGVKNSQTLHKVLRGQNMSQPRVSFEDLVEMYDDQLKAAKSQLTSSPLPSASSKHQPVPTVPRSTNPDPSSLLEGAVRLNPSMALATLLGAALPLARHLDSPKTSAQERAAFRDLIGQENLFDMSNMLNSLCSERARTHGR